MPVYISVYSRTYQCILCILCICKGSFDVIRANRQGGNGKVQIIDSYFSTMHQYSLRLCTIHLYY